MKRMRGWFYRRIWVGRSGLSCVCGVLGLAIGLIVASGAALAQSCPERRPPKRVGSGYDSGIRPSARQTISGTVIFHGNLWNWYSLRPATAMCGQTEFEIQRSHLLCCSFDQETETQKQMERMTGCAVSAVGELRFRDDRVEGDHSPVVLEAWKVVPDASCRLKPASPDARELKPAPNVRRYAVTMTVNLAGEGSVRVVASGQGRVLRPWQAYANYVAHRMVGGGEDYLVAACGYGFVNSDVSSSPAGAQMMLYNAELPIDSAINAPIVMTYTCTRVVPPGE